MNSPSRARQEPRNNVDDEINQLLNSQVGDTKSLITFKALLLQGLTQVCKKKPMGEEAIIFLGEWLLLNNPNQPKFIVADDIC